MIAGTNSNIKYSVQSNFLHIINWTKGTNSIQPTAADGYDCKSIAMHYMHGYYYSQWTVNLVNYLNYN